MNVNRIVLVAISLFIAACATQRQWTEADYRELAARFVPVDEPVKSWAFQIADNQAQHVLDEYNSGPAAEVARDGGPFHLDQYSRDVVRIIDPGTDKNLIVSYRLQVPANFFGHPEHFAVMLCEQTGETRVMGGY